MKPVLIAYASRDGQAHKLARTLAACWQAQGLRCELYDLRLPPPQLDAACVVWISAVRYGRHLPEALAFLQAWRDAWFRLPLAMVSVSLSARKPGGGERYLRRVLQRWQLTPIATLCAAGRLDYSRMRGWQRPLLRLIMRLSGGQTDPLSRIEYTDWRAVERFAAGLLPALHALVRQ